MQYAYPSSDAPSVLCDNQSQIEDFIAIEGDILYQYLAGDLLITNISTPSNPVLISQTDLTFPDSISNVYFKNSFAYFFTFENDLIVYDCTDPLNVDFQFDFPFDGCVHDIVVTDDYLYVTQDKNVTIYSLSTYGVSKLSEVTVNCTYYLMYLVVHEGFAYAYTFQEDLNIVNVTDPAHPVYNASWSVNAVRQITHCDDLVLEFSVGYYEFRVLDISSPGQPEILCYVNYTGRFFPFRDVFYYDQYIYSLYGDGGIAVYDASDLTNITLVLEYQLSASVDDFQVFFAMEIVNEHIFMSFYGGKPLHVVDISNPLLPDYIYPLYPNIGRSEIIKISITAGIYVILIAVIAIVIVRVRKLESP